MAAIAQIPFVFPTADASQYQVLRRSGSIRVIEWGDYLRTTDQGLLMPTIAGNALKQLRVNAGATALEFAAIDLSGYVPYTGATGNLLLGVKKLQTPVIFPASDSTTAVQINKADGTTNVLNVDTTNGRVLIGTASPGAGLSIKGGASATDSVLSIVDDSNTYSLFKVTGDGTVTIGDLNRGNLLKIIGSGDGASKLIIGDTNGYGGKQVFTFRSNENATLTSNVLNIVALNDSLADVTTIMSLVPNGNVGIGTTSPTAVVHIKAGTATANTAPLKFTSGTLLTTPEVGALEFLTDDFFATITTGGARKGIVLTDGVNLTSGRIPAATTNGRLVDGPVPATDGTYNNPTHITIAKGIITAIS